MSGIPGTGGIRLLPLSLGQLQLGGVEASASRKAPDELRVPASIATPVRCRRGAGADAPTGARG